MAIAVLGTACGDSRCRQRAARSWSTSSSRVSSTAGGRLRRRGFFVVRNDAELRDFFMRDELTEAERAEFAELGEDCLDG
ncbi:MAG: hypothetical protein R2713_09110 [Ilumatobacteraceae bacterium]